MTEPEPALVAYQINPLPPVVGLFAAPIDRAWMDEAPHRFPYRCLPLAIANQCGWVMTCPTSFSAYWYGGHLPGDLEVRFDDPTFADGSILSHFGSGVLTFTVPYLFRTPKGINLWVKGPTNWPKDGIQALEGIVETDWSASTFTMNWKMTRTNEWVRFEQGEPFCMIVPVPRGLAESLAPRVELLSSNDELEKQYQTWEASRRGFLQGLKTHDPQAVQRGWQKDYFQGKTPDGQPADGHQTRLKIREFEPDAGARPARTGSPELTDSD